MTYLLLLILHSYFSFDGPTDETLIINKLNKQADCWNVGDIDCFMQDYWHHDSLMYIGKNGVTYGWQNTLDNYKLKYPTKSAMGQLKFEFIKLERLGPKHYLMVGKWKLERQAGNLEGHFTLIWKRIDDNWLIISDHSS